MFKRSKKEEKKGKKEEEIEFKELEKDRAYAFKVGKVKFLSVKLPTSGLSEIRADVGPGQVGGARKKEETKEWLTIVRGEDFKTRPYEAWAKLASKGLTTSTSTTVTSGSIAVSTTPPPPHWVETHVCPKCQSQVEKDFKHCPYCGSQLE